MPWVTRMVPGSYGGMNAVDVWEGEEEVFEEPAHMSPHPTDSRFVYSRNMHQWIPAPGQAMYAGDTPPSEDYGTDAWLASQSNALKEENNRLIATEALTAAQNVTTRLEVLIDTGSVTPQLTEARAVAREGMKEAEAAFARDDAAGVYKAAQLVLTAGESAGVIDGLPDPPSAIVQPARVHNPIPALTAAPIATNLPSNRMVTASLQEWPTVAELNQMIEGGNPPRRTDGTFFTLNRFQGGWLMDGAPLNVWTGPGWYTGQKEALTPYWTTGEIPTPPADVLNKPVVGDVPDSPVLAGISNGWLIGGALLGLFLLRR